jgi:SAM-dependent methyltransferase
MVRASFRDPSGRTWVEDAAIYRASWDGPSGSAPDRKALLDLLQSLQFEGSWIAATPLDPSSFPPFLRGDCPLPSQAWEHPRLFFPSYAYEWSPAMLHRAAELTLDINERLLQAHWELKDASPSNLLFDGARPCFVDHLSPSPRRPGQLGWAAYGQFVRTFLIPLCLHRLRGLPLGWVHLARRDGLPPEEALPLLSLADRVRPSVLGLITLPAHLSRRQGTAPARSLQVWKEGDEGIGAAVTARLLRGLRRRLARWTPGAGRATLWSRYDQAGESYDTEALRAKEAFLRQALAESKPDAVLDLGCNTGRYARLAAQAGARVVAVDGDPACIDQLWRQAQSEGLDILPLVMDLGRPSPALGWENGEEQPFLERARGRFDMVFGLALVHHLLVRERVPLDRVVAHFASLTRRWAVLEWVPPSDPQFERLAGPHRDLYSGLDVTTFESALAHCFQIVRRLQLPGSARVLYFLEKP